MECQLPWNLAGACKGMKALVLAVTFYKQVSVIVATGGDFSGGGKGGGKGDGGAGSLKLSLALV